MATTLPLAAVAADARTYFTPERMREVEARVARHDWARAGKKSILSQCEWYLKMEPAQFWDFVPPATQLRAINVSHGVGCPDCGEAIFSKGGHYPWEMDRERPFHVRCPICSREFPETPFVPWNPGPRTIAPEQGTPIADRGAGWQDAEGHRFWFVAYYIFWQRWRKDVVDGANLLGRAYLLTGDMRYARRAGIMLAAVAQRYSDFHYEDQVYHEGIWNIRGRISDYIWTCGDNSKLARAYDAVRPALQNDAPLREILAGHGVADPCELIGNGMLRTMEEDILRGYVAGNMGMHQRTLCQLALVRHNDDSTRGPTTSQVRDWIFSGGGRVEDLLWNGFWRDGFGGESSPSYSAGWGSKFYELADLLPRIGLHIWDNPKMRKMADAAPDMLVADEFAPCIGDCGGVRGAKNVGFSASVHGRAFARYGDTRHADALRRIGARDNNLWDHLFDPVKLEEAVQTPPPPNKTRVLGGYGLAILESGSGENRRGASLYFGDATGGHGHYDRLTLGFFDLGYPMFSEMGYPTPFRTPRRFGWTSNTISHYSVLVDERPHENRNRGRLHSLVGGAFVQLMEASAENVYPGRVDLYRRTTALIDIDPEHGYLLDIFRIRGGKQHDWSFHGPAFTEFSVAGVTPGPVRPGTLAGADHAYGEPPADKKRTNGYEFFFNTRLMRPDSVWSATWRNPVDGAALTMTMPEGCVDEVILGEAKPELQKGNPEVIRYTLGRRTFPEGGKSLSAFVAVSEAHHDDTRRVRAVHRLERLSGPDTAIAVCVERDGTVDLVHSALDATHHCIWKYKDTIFDVSAEFATVTIDSEGVSRATFVNGHHLRYGALALNAAPPLVGEVTAVDLRANTITIDIPLPDPSVCNGLAALLGNETNHTAYMVEHAESAEDEDGTVLHFGHTLMRLGMGEVAAIDGKTRTITSDRTLSGYGRTDGGRHQGRWLCGDDLATLFPIAAVGKNTFVLENADTPLETAFRDQDGDGRALYWICDIGPGDWVKLPSRQEYTRPATSTNEH
ncbi:MAG: heparinase II/III family protein [Lentisphaeria bacterium]|nr:heparinase II/III family protein [Lentisphaeria bacterium]